MSSGQDEWRDEGISYYGGHDMVHIPCGTKVYVPSGSQELVLLDGGPICPKCQTGFAATPNVNPA
jgi:hypothetical protein